MLWIYMSIVSIHIIMPISWPCNSDNNNPFGLYVLNKFTRPHLKIDPRLFQTCFHQFRECSGSLHQGNRTTQSIGSSKHPSIIVITRQHASVCKRVEVQITAYWCRKLFITNWWMVFLVLYRKKTFIGFLISLFC